MQADVEIVNQASYALIAGMMDCSYGANFNKIKDSNDNERYMAKDTHHSLLAIEVYQDMLARGIQPSQELRKLLEQATCHIEHQTVSFPILRKIAICNLPGPASTTAKSKSKSKSKGKEVPRIPAQFLTLSKATPAQLFLVALEAGDFALAKPLYVYARSQGSFRWDLDNVQHHSRFFVAMVKDLLNSQGSRSKQHNQTASIFAAEIYLDWREEGLSTDIETIKPIIELLAGISHSNTFRTTLNSLLSDESILLSASLFADLFQALKIKSFQSDVNDLYNTFQDVISYSRYERSLTLKMYRAVLSAFARSEGRFESPWPARVFDHMLAIGVEPDVQTFNLFMNIQSLRVTTIEKVESTHEALLARGLTPDRDTYSVLIASYLKTNQWEKAIQTIRHVFQLGIPIHTIVARTVTQLMMLDKEDEALNLYNDWVVLVKSTCQSIGAGSRTDYFMRNMQAALGLNKQERPTRPLITMDVTNQPVPNAETEIATKGFHDYSDFPGHETIALPEATILGIEAQRHVQDELDLESERPFLRNFVKETPDMDLLPLLDVATSSAAITEAPLDSQEVIPQNGSRAVLEGERVPSIRSKADFEANKAEAEEPYFSCNSTNISMAAPNLSYNTSDPFFVSRSAGATQTPQQSTTNTVQPAAQYPLSFRSFHQRIASLSYDQIANLRSRIELEALGRQERELQMSRSILWKRADASRWDGWNEFAATPWY